MKSCDAITLARSERLAGEHDVGRRPRKQALLHLRSRLVAVATGIVGATASPRAEQVELPAPGGRGAPRSGLHPVARGGAPAGKLALAGTLPALLD